MFKEYDVPNHKSTAIENIAVFRVAEDTKRNVRDVFIALSHIWAQYLGTHMLKRYRDVIVRAYDAKMVALFDKVVLAQRKAVFGKIIPQHLNRPLEFLNDQWKLLLYGTGCWGKIYFDYARFYGLKVSGMVVSDGREISENSKEVFETPIYHLSELTVAADKCVVLLAMEGENYKVCTLCQGLIVAVRVGR